MESDSVPLGTFPTLLVRYARSMSGVQAPERTGVDSAITAGMPQYGGVDIRNMWGLPQLGRWKWDSPYDHAAQLAQNATRIWVYSPGGNATLDPAAMPGYADIINGANRTFYDQYSSVGGANAQFDLCHVVQPDSHGATRLTPNSCH